MTSAPDSLSWGPSELPVGDSMKTFAMLARVVDPMDSMTKRAVMPPTPLRFWLKPGSSDWISALDPGATALCESQLPPPSMVHTVYSSAAPCFQTAR